jgi:uncharacterized protein YxjI
MHGAPAPAGHSSTVPAASARFTHQTRKEFKVKEVFGISGDNFKIVDAQTGAAAFNMRGKLFSLKEKKTLCDASGTPIYSLTEALISLRGSMHIQDASTKQTVITMRKKGFIPMMGTNTIQAWRGTSDVGTPWLEVKVRLPSDHDILGCRAPREQ